MKNGFVSWIIFSTAFEPLRLSSGCIVACWLIEIWLQAGNYQIQFQPKIRIPLSLLGMCIDRHSDRAAVCLCSIEEDLEFEELNLKLGGF